MFCAAKVRKKRATDSQIKFFVNMNSFDNWVALNLLTMIVIAFLPHTEIVFSIYIGIITIIPIAYSYVEYKKLGKG